MVRHPVPGKKFQADYIIFFSVCQLWHNSYGWNSRSRPNEADRRALRFFPRKMVLGSFPFISIVLETCFLLRDYVE